MCYQQYSLGWKQIATRVVLIYNTRITTMNILDKITALYAPHECVGCQREGAVWCLACRPSAPQAVRRCYRCKAADPDNLTCKACRRSTPLTRVQASTRYELTAKAVLWQLKFGRMRAAATEIAAFMQPSFEKLKGSEVIVVHIPTATSRVRMRGYDQAKLIARACAGRAGLRHASLLMRTGQERQVGVRRSQRLTQLENAFRIKNPVLVKGAHIVLVDDVVTTGATLEAAAKVLKAAGAKKIEAIVFAQA